MALRLKARVENLHWHDLRHCFVSRALLVGIPLPVVLKASGHSAGSPEWYRYANLDNLALRGLLKPHLDQSAEEVRSFAKDILHGIQDALGYREIEELLNLDRTTVG